MLYIAKHIDVSYSEVLGFSDSLTNTLGASYIIMRANKGISSNKIWFDQDEDGDDDIVNAGLPDKALVNFLRSLAAYRNNFDNDPETPAAGPTYHWKSVSEMA
jgi:hypothetical protein